MSATLVQYNSGTSGAATSVSSFATTFLAASTAGNTILLIISDNAVVSTPSGWVLDRSQVNDTGHYVYRRTSAGETGFTIPVTSWGCWALLELANLVASPLDGAISAGTSSLVATQSTGTTATLTQADEYGVATWTSSGGGVVTFSGETNGYAEIIDVQTTNAAGPHVGLCVATQVLASTAAQTSTATLSTSRAATGILVTYKAGPVPRTVADHGTAADKQAIAVTVVLTSLVGRAGYSTGGYSDGYDPSTTAPRGEVGRAADTLRVIQGFVIGDAGIAADSWVTVGGATNKFMAGSAIGADNYRVTVAVTYTDSATAADALTHSLGRAGYATGGYTDGYDTSPSIAVFALPADTGQCTDNLLVNRPRFLNDSGTAAESLVQQIMLADGSTTADQVSVSNSFSVGESGAAADALTVAATLPLTDSATAATAPRVDIALPMFDVGIGADQMTSTGAPTPKTVGDSAVAADVLTVDQQLPLFDSGLCWLDALTGLSSEIKLVTDEAHAVEQIAVANTLQQADSAYANDVLVVSVAVGFTDAATSVETFTADVTARLADTALVADALTVNVAASVADTATASEQSVKSILTSSPTAGDVGQAVDTLKISAAFVLTEHGIGANQIVGGGRPPVVTHGLGTTTLLQSGMTTAMLLTAGSARAQIRVRTGQTMAVVQ